MNVFDTLGERLNPKKWVSSLKSLVVKNTATSMEVNEEALLSVLELKLYEFRLLAEEGGDVQEMIDKLEELIGQLKEGEISKEEIQNLYEIYSQITPQVN